VATLSTLYYHLSKDHVLIVLTKNPAFDGYVFATQGVLNSLASPHWMMLSNAGLNVCTLPN
jgi:hypothetical protein